MTAICTEGISTNPEILAVSDRIFQTLRLSIERATNVLNNVPANKLPAKGLEKEAHNFFKTYITRNRSAVMRLGNLSQGRGVNVQLRSNRSKFNFNSTKTIVEQAKAAKMFDGLKFSKTTIAKVSWNARTKKFIIPTDKADYAKMIIEAIAAKRSQAGQTTAPAPQNFRELRLKLSKLKAIRRFGWELTDWGDDQIVCGGDGLSSLQEHKKVSQFIVHTFKRDGAVFNFSPHKTFVKFDLSKPGPWPRGFISNIFIAEKDADGGFIEFLQKLWDAIGKEVISLASSLAAAAAGATIGAVIGTELMPLVGTIIGAIVGGVIGLFVGWILDSLKDDIFESPDNPLGLVLASADSLFDGNSPRSPVFNQEFTAGSARYIMSYYWELS